MEDHAEANALIDTARQADPGLNTVIDDESIVQTTTGNRELRGWVAPVVSTRYVSSDHTSCQSACFFHRSSPSQNRQ